METFTKIKRFILDESLTIEENRQYEFKEVKGNNPVDSIKNGVDEYVVAFLNLSNGNGGSIYWGIENNTGKCVGVKLDAKQRDEIRKSVNSKLFQITPALTPNSYQINFHHVYDANDEAISGLWIVEVTVSSPLTDDLYFAGGKTAFIKTDSGKKELSGLELVDEIKRRARIISANREKEILSLDSFLSLIDDFKPLLYWLHKSVPSQDARRYFSALQIVFALQYFYANKTLQYGIDNLLRAFSHFQSRVNKDDNYIQEKIRIACLEFGYYLNEVNYVDNPLKRILGLNTNEMISISYSTFKNLEITSYKIPLEDELMIHFILSLLHYFIKHKDSLSKGKYADIPENVTNLFKSLAAHELFTRFGVNFPDANKDFSEIEILCEDSWVKYQNSQN